MLTIKSARKAQQRKDNEMARGQLAKIVEHLGEYRVGAETPAEAVKRLVAECKAQRASSAMESTISV